MTEEEYFRKTYPDSCYGDKPLSPYWDFFQDGVEFSERQSENKIVDIKANCDLAIEGRDIKIKELENQVKDLEWQVQEVAKDNDYYQAENKKLEQQIEKMKEVISELIAITDKDICKECDGGIHCSECYVNHAQTYASHFINEKEIEK